MKNTIIRVISACMAASVILATCGCGAKNASEKQNSAELNQPVINESTAFIEYTSVDDKGNETDQTNVDKIEISDVNLPELGLTLEEHFDNEGYKEHFESLTDDYGIDEEECKEMEENAEDWQEFDYYVYVANSNAKRIAFEYISRENINGLILSESLDCQYGIGSGYGMTICLSGLADKNKYADETAIKEALSSMDVKIKYTFVDSIDDTVDDWSSVETKEMPIDFSR